MSFAPHFLAATAIVAGAAGCAAGAPVASAPTEDEASATPAPPRASAEVPIAAPPAAASEEARRVAPAPPAVDVASPARLQALLAGPPGTSMGIADMPRLGGAAVPDARSGDAGAPPGPTGSVAPGSGDVQGGLDPDVVRRAMAARMPAIRRCYVNALRADPALSAQLRVRFVDVTGAVAQAADESPRPAPADLRDCVLRVVRTITVSRPPGGDAVAITYPFTLTPVAATP